MDDQPGVLSIKFELMTPVKGGVGIGSTRELGDSGVLGAAGVPWNCCPRPNGTETGSHIKNCAPPERGGALI